MCLFYCLHIAGDLLAESENSTAATPSAAASAAAGLHPYSMQPLGSLVLAAVLIVLVLMMQ